MCELHSLESHCVFTAQSREGYVCAAQSREALCTAQSREALCVCTAQYIEALCVYCTV